MTYEFGEFRLDHAVLRFRDSVVPLTPKAIDTLYLLVSRAPEVVSKDEIMSTIWPDTFVVESSLARNISVIRKALEDHAGEGEFIETIPKRGYRFVAELRLLEARTVEVRPTPAEEAVALKAAPETVQEYCGLDATLKDQQKVPEPPSPTRTERISFRSWFPAVIAVALILAAAAAASTFRPKDPPPQPDASVLIGRYLLYKATPSDAKKALASLEEAVAANPQSAQAHTGLAEALLVLPQLAMGGTDSFARAKEEAETAIRLDDRLASAHSVLGGAKLLADWDFQGAEASLKRALELDPNSPIALLRWAQLNNSLGQFSESQSALERAVKADPVSPLLTVELGVVYYYQKRFEDAARQFRAVLAREPDYTLAHYYLALCDGFLGRADEAISHLSQSRLHPGVLRTDESWVRLKTGNSAAAERIYADLKAQTDAGKLGPSAPVLLAISLGRMDDAFALVDQCFEEKCPELLALQSDPRLEPLRSDRRYPEAVRRLLAGGR